LIHSGLERAEQVLSLREPKDMWVFPKQRMLEAPFYHVLAISTVFDQIY
jgi:hypothetical protein